MRVDIEGICDKEGKLIKPYVRNEVKNGGAEKCKESIKRLADKG